MNPWLYMIDFWLYSRYKSLGRIKRNISRTCLTNLCFLKITITFDIKCNYFLLRVFFRPFFYKVNNDRIMKMTQNNIQMKIYLQKYCSSSCNLYLVLASRNWINWPCLLNLLPKGAGPLGNHHRQLLFQYLGRQRGNIFFLSLDSQFIKYSTVIG